MNPVGEVIAILNNDFLLVKFYKDDNYGHEDQFYEVVEKIESPELAKINGLDHLVFPKGKILINKRQQENIYLASPQLELKKEKKRIFKEKRNSLSLLFNPFEDQSFSEEVEHEKPVGRTARLSHESSLNLSLNNEVKVGDFLLAN